MTREAKQSKAKLKEKSESVVVQVDPTLKRLYEKAMKELEALDVASMTSWQKRYLVAASVVEHVPPLFLAGGYSTDREFFEAEMEETTQSARRNIRVAKLATVEEVKKLKVTRLRFAVTYLEAMNKRPLESRGEVNFESLRIQFMRNDKSVTRSLSTITHAEMAEAMAQFAEKPKAATAPPEAKAVLAAFKRAAVKGATATVNRSSLVMRIPLKGIAAVLHALAEGSVPTG